MDKTKAIEICKQWVKLFGEISYDFVSDEDEATYKERGEALQTLIAHAEKAPVKWFNEQATEEAFILDLMFATGCRTENIIANNQMRKRIKDVLTAYQEAAKGRECPQRQDSLTDQMNTVIDLARKNGCYDAQDWIQRTFGQAAKKETE